MLLANNAENIDCGQIWACANVTATSALSCGGTQTPPTDVDVDVEDVLAQAVCLYARRVSLGPDESSS